jgi:hypothetical protein
VSAIYAADPRDASTFYIGITHVSHLPIGRLLEELPTDAVYGVRDLCDKVLAKRPDARR